jgi:hypothetical protein
MAGVSPLASAVLFVAIAGGVVVESQDKEA